MVNVTEADIDAAEKYAFDFYDVDCGSPKFQRDLSLALAAHRIATIEECATLADNIGQHFTAAAIRALKGDQP